jgi:hypothetical protein
VGVNRNNVVVFFFTSVIDVNPRQPFSGFLRAFVKCHLAGFVARHFDTEFKGAQIMARRFVHVAQHSHVLRSSAFLSDVNTVTGSIILVRFFIHFKIEKTEVGNLAENFAFFSSREPQ